MATAEHGESIVRLELAISQQGLLIARRSPVDHPSITSLEPDRIIREIDRKSTELLYTVAFESIANFRDASRLIETQTAPVIPKA